MSIDEIQREEHFRMTDSRENSVEILKKQEDKQTPPQGVKLPNQGLGPKISSPQAGSSVPMILGGTGQWACL